jgi:hypothetical protein
LGSFRAGAAVNDTAAWGDRAEHTIHASIALSALQQSESPDIIYDATTHAFKELHAWLRSIGRPL